jgi:hypothetical protein
MAYVLTEKLKGLKPVIRNWDREVYGGMDAKIENLISEISVLDLQAELVGLSEGEVIRRKSLFSEMWHLKISKASLTAQRSRSRWLKEGDTNSRYFHACIKSRAKQNSIIALRTEGGGLRRPLILDKLLCRFFAIISTPIFGCVQI